MVLGGDKKEYFWRKQQGREPRVYLGKGKAGTDQQEFALVVNLASWSLLRSTGRVVLDLKPHRGVRLWFVTQNSLC